MLDPHEIVVPDLSGWRRERLPDLPADRPIRVRPDWVCEVASPSNRWRDRDPDERTLEAFEAHEGAWVRLGAWSDGDAPRVAPFEAIALDVGGLYLPVP